MNTKKEKIIVSIGLGTGIGSTIFCILILILEITYGSITLNEIPLIASLEIILCLFGLICMFYIYKEYAITYEVK